MNHSAADSHAAEVTSSASPSYEDGLPMPARWRAAAVLLLAFVITVFDAVMSNVALPRIAENLSIDPSRVVWIPIAYSLAVVMTLLPLSAVSVQIGVRRLFAWGTVIFIVASIAAGLANSFALLLAARVVQALGTSMLMCLFGGIVRNIYPARLLGMGLSLNAMTVAISSVLAPSLGAFLLDLASWRWIFFSTVPFSLVMLLGIRYLPEPPRQRIHFDVWACILNALTFGLSILGLDLLTTRPVWASLCLVGAAVSAHFMVQRSLTQKAPIVPVDLLKITSVGYAVLASVFSFASQMAAMVALPFYFQQVRSASFTDIGFYLGAWSIGVAVMAPVAGYLTRQVSVAMMCIVGGLGTAMGLAWVLLLGAEGSTLNILLAMLLSGIGFGFFQTPNNRALLVGVPRPRANAAGGMQAAARVFGQSFGTALIALVFGASATQGPTLGVVAALVCALVAVGVNIARHFNPASDPQIS